MKRMLITVFSALLCAVWLLSGCAPQPQTNESALDQSSEQITYARISMSQAAKRMEEESGYLIVDVRRPDEFATGHIPNAINVPNESIGSSEIKELPDKDQLIFVYCRSGNRSVQASEKLVALGYTNIVEIGGILQWGGAIEQ